MSNGRRNKKSRSKLCKGSYSINQVLYERAFQAQPAKATAFGGGRLLDLTGGSHPGLFGVVTRQVGPLWFVGTTFGIEAGLAGVLVAGAVWLGVLIFSRACH